jgi:hypothetical protein
MLGFIVPSLPRTFCQFSLLWQYYFCFEFFELELFLFAEAGDLQLCCFSGLLEFALSE